LISSGALAKTRVKLYAQIDFRAIDDEAKLECSACLFEDINVARCKKCESHFCKLCTDFIFSRLKACPVCP
jgi:hypothetical protein